MREIFSYNTTKRHENITVNIEFNKKITKIETEFFELLLFNLDLNSDNLSFDTKDLLKILNIKSEEKLQEFFINLTGKKIIYSITKDSKTLYNGAFSLIHSYFKKKEKIYISTAEELKLFLSGENIFYHFNFKKHIFMERNLSLILHSYLSSILPNTSLTISVAELKELFELKDMYNRYYDFEKHILKKVIKNINKYTDLEVKYQKTSNSLVNFTFKNISKNDIFEKTQEIIDIIKDKVLNEENIYNLILNYLEKRGYNYVYNNTLYAYNLKSIKNFDSHLKKALLYDLFSSNQKKHEKKKEHILFFEKYHSYKNSILLQNDLYKYINSILYVTSSLEELYSFEVINEIKNLEDGSIFAYENADFRIFVEFLKNKNSSVQIFFREDLLGG
ncbi:MAG: replication initiation protein [Sebaldella sp.]|nr:replication initiation protein [Sebaldella sp.]